MLGIGVLVTLAAVASTPPGVRGGTDPAQSARTRRLLVYTVSAGFEHDVVRRPEPSQLSLVERTLVDLGRAANFEAVPTRDPAEFERAQLARYDAVLFYTTGELPLTPEQRAAFLDFVAQGKGFVGVHPATDTFYAWPEYGALVGAYFDGHPWHEKVRVRVEDGAHPATRSLDASFDIVDEIYQFRAPYDRARLHVLLTLDADAADLTKAGVNRTDRDFALAWTRTHGQGRVFYTALGHRPEVWSDPRFLSHLRGGIEWSLRIEREPVVLAPEDEALRVHAGLNRGDPARGFAIFRRESGPMCIRCHAVHGEGGTVGPDLSKLARERTRAEILEQVLAPSAAIAEGYRATIFEMRDGTLFTGRIQSETKERIRAWDVEGKVRELAPGDVADRRESPVSLMPQGLARTLTPGEFADLAAWLETLKGS